MSVSVSVFQTIACDGPKCGKAEVLETMPSGQPVPAMQKLLAETPWLTSNRQVISGGKQFLFCSDVCLVNAATAGMFIPEEEKKVAAVDGNGNAQIRAALADKARTAAADAALRSGAPVTISPK